MSQTEPEIERIGKKARRHINVSREFDGAADELLSQDTIFSEWAEKVLWEALIDEHGLDAVLRAVEETQSEIDEEDLLDDEYRETYTLPA